MDAIKKKTPSRYQLYLTCIIALVILIIYAGFTLTRNATVTKPPNIRNHIINTVLPNRSRQPNKTASKPCLKNAFKDILLVIVYNYPFYDSIPHLVALYKPAFPNLLFCGPPDEVVHPDILTINIIKGRLGYECLGRAIQEHPGHEGYFYISDDVILKYWNFPNFDRDKFWESRRPFTSPASGPASNGWYWWNTRYGLSNCRRALEDVAKTTLKEKKLNGAHLLNTLLKNGNGKLLCFGGRSDVLYVPQKHAKVFSILSETFYKQQVFLEIAAPTIYRLLERNENIALLPGYYIPGKVGDPRVSDSRFFWHLYFPHNEFHFIHPFKLHREGIDSKFNLVMMKYIFIKTIKTLTNCTPTLP
ncbi:uncharacterized protein LOC144666900 isoform X1 [Oculina patagonica]